MDSDGHSTRSSNKSKNKAAPDGTEKVVGKSTGSDSAPRDDDWREQIRIEVRAAMADIATQREQERHEPVVQPGPFEINAEDVVNNETVAGLVKKLDAENRSNKTAIRLGRISKEGNRQHFQDMIEIKEKAEEAAAALQGSRKEERKKE